MGRLEGKVAIITGGNSGVGEQTAKRFAKEGAKVVITARRKEKLESVAADIEADGGTVLALQGDISVPGDGKRIVEAAAEHFGTLDILVNNAGVLDEGLLPIDKVADSEIDRIIDINTKGTMYFIRAALEIMLKNKSRIYRQCGQHCRIERGRRSCLRGFQGGRPGYYQTHGYAVCKRRGSVQCHLSGHDQDSDDSRTDDGFYGPGYDGGHGCAF